MSRRAPSRNGLRSPVAGPGDAIAGRRRWIASGAGLLVAALGGLVACQGGRAQRFLDSGLATAADVFEAGGRSDVAKALRGSRLALRSFRDINVDQEHYIGRSVCAEVLANPSFRVSDDRARAAYVSSIGQSVAMGADSVRVTYQGYRFVLLDSPTINAFALPGGYVFVTEGAVNATRNEDELAGILAHEVAHVHLKHGLQAIRESNLVAAGEILFQELEEEIAKRDQKRLTSVFGDSVTDVASAAVHGGFSREQEREADVWGARFLSEVGYAPQALADLLQRSDFDGGGFAAEHPSGAERARNLRSRVGAAAASDAPGYEARRQRHERALR